MPARYGPIGTVWSRFYRWRQAAVVSVMGVELIRA
ncbi:transposase [Methylobacterium soli]|uniref:Transposase n=1 Tax=Methylobacterium soli TaxID=553447 RepID=A0A6L3SSQ1_9HYPH|nr:transposase [Methylobacterium soli]